MDLTFWVPLLVGLGLGCFAALFAFIAACDWI